MKKKINNGFTLAELLIVVAIIAVLVAISIPIFSAQLEKAKQATDLANMRSAKAAAVAEYLGNSESEDKTYYYDAAKGKVSETDKPADGYGRSSKKVSEFDTVMPGASGVPNENGKANYITVTVNSTGEVYMRWGGNDLSTPEGRRREDIDTMHEIKDALLTAYNNDKIIFAKNYVQVAVFADGSVKMFQDRYNGEPWSEENTSSISDALKAAGINTDNIPINSTDAKWKNGYIIHLGKDGTVSYKQLDASDNTSENIGWGWWNKPNIEDADLIN